jgi:hypothetical protein
MTGHHDKSEHEDYAADKYEIGFEDGTDMKDDGSETGEKVLGATDTVTWPTSRKRRLRLRKRRRQGCSNRFVILCSLTEQRQEEVEHQAEAVAAGVGPSGET